MGFAVFAVFSILLHVPELVHGAVDRQAGLDIAFDFAVVACLVAAVASLLRGKHYVHGESAPTRAGAGGAVGVRKVAIAEDLQESPKRLSAPPEPALRLRQQK